MRAVGDDDQKRVLRHRQEGLRAFGVTLDQIKGVMHSSGEGKWTLDTAMERQIATPVIALSVMMRYRSLVTDTFSGKIVAALRNEFGGHAVDKK